MKYFIAAMAFMAFLQPFRPLAAEQKKTDQYRQIEHLLQAQVPYFSFKNAEFATSGKPSAEGYALLAANGFHSVVCLGTGMDEIDVDRERSLAEKAGLKFINIPVVSIAPKPQQADAFLKAARDASNLPMLIFCPTGNRTAAFWMFHRVVNENWTIEKALKEAENMGLASQRLKEFALGYLSAGKKP